MGEKPTEQDEAAAKSMDKSSPELMGARETSAPSLSEIAVSDPGSPAGIAVSDPGMPPERPSANREAGSGMATGRVAAGDVTGDGRSDIAIGDPGVNGNIAEDGGGALAAGDVDADGLPDQRRAGMGGAQTNPMYEKKDEGAGQEDPARLAIKEKGGPQGPGGTKSASK